MPSNHHNLSDDGAGVSKTAGSANQPNSRSHEPQQARRRPAILSGTLPHDAGRASLEQPDPAEGKNPRGRKLRMRLRLNEFWGMDPSCSFQAGIPLTLSCCLVLLGCGPREVSEGDKQTAMEVKNKLVEGASIYFAKECTPPKVELTGDAAFFVRSLMLSMLAAEFTSPPEERPAALEWGCFQAANFTVHLYEYGLVGQLAGSKKEVFFAEVRQLVPLKEAVQRDVRWIEMADRTSVPSQDDLERVLADWKPER